ncbi:MAG TPA: hypothetical protein VFC74_04645 [Oscillospiraceae bacterium]|nr:hypothetical protein [Oscillospiraceae bacterium]
MKTKGENKSFFILIPPLAVIMIFGLLIVNIVLAIGILRFMKKCEERI